MKFGPGISAIHFNEHWLPFRPIPDIAIADLNPLPPGAKSMEELAGTGWPRWQAQKYEGEQTFRDRITAELKADGDLGECVFIYARCSFWQRNMRGQTL